MPSRRRRTALLPITLAILLTGAAPAESAEAPGERVLLPEVAMERRAAPDPSTVPEVLRLPPAAEAAASSLEALRAQPVLPGVPYRNGFSRSEPDHRVRVAAATLALQGAGTLEASSAPDASGSWLGRFVVEGSYGFRVLLRDLELPEGARIWLYAGDFHLGPFGTELLDPEGELWLPPAPGPEVVVEIELPESPAGAGGAPALAFTVGEVMELMEVPAPTDVEPQVWTDCDVDAVCVDTGTLSTIDMLRQATARLTFVDGASSFLCSGGLMNDTDSSGFRPFLLTANHCFDTQASASSLVAYFDYRTDSCDGSAPGLFEVPSVSGATLLATSPDSDFTFVELSSLPAGSSWFLGWTTTTPTSGTAMHRVSHPEGTPQKYTASSYTGSDGIVCSGLPVSNFHYSETTTGSTAGGSSGAPVTVTVSGDARVVGQLLGVCHFSSWDDCSYATYNNIDGAFSVTFPFIQSWLDPAPACTADAFEPDDSSVAASSIASSSPQAHSLCPVGDEDWVTFTLGEESEVTIETSGATGDTVMTLYDSNLSQVEFDDDGGADFFSFIDRECGVDALPAGTYYVQIEEFLGGALASYTLSYTRVQGCGSCPADLTLANTTITGTQSHRAGTSITLGPSLTVHGTAIDVLAGERVVITSGTEIGGSFSAGTDPLACSL